MSRKLRLTALILVAALMIVSFTGCKKETSSLEGGNVEINGDAIYPLKTDDTLTVWMELNALLSTTYSNFGDTPLAAELEKKTGVKVEYIHPAQGQTQEQFNLLLASDGLPDIVRANWYNVGADKAIQHGYITELNEVMEKWAPNLSKLLSKNKEFDRIVKTDTGKYYVFPFLRETKELCVYTGPIVRKDWLDKLNMEVPETIQEWEEMLVKFRDEMGADIPLSSLGSFLNKGFISSAFGVTSDFFVGNDGKVKFGPNEEGYIEYLKLMKRWYDMGILDQNFASIDSNVLQTNILSSRTGATCHNAGGGLARWMAAMETEDSEFELVGAPYPVLKKGDRPQISIMEWPYNPSSSYAISQDCKNVELAARWLDYGYSEEGHLTYNFGIEDVSYSVEENYPTLTELITNNPDGTPMTSVLPQYVMGSYSGPFVQDKRLVEQTQSLSQQREAAITWADTDGDKHLLPLFSYTSEELSELTTIRADLSTYVNEMTFEFIMGTKSLDDYDSFLEQLKAMKLERALEIMNDALKRYNNR